MFPSLDEANQMLGKEIDRTVILEVVLEQELLIFVLYEVFGIALPWTEVNLWKKAMSD